MCIEKMFEEEAVNTDLVYLSHMITKEVARVVGEIGKKSISP